MNKLKTALSLILLLSGTYTVAYAQSISITSIEPSTLTVSPGGSASITVTISRTSYTGSVSLAITSSLPSGVTATYSHPGTGNTGTITLTASTSVATGTTTQTVRASGTGVSSTTRTFSLTVAWPAGIGSLSISPSSVTLNPGSSVSISATITRVNGFTGSVSLLITSTLPSGVTATYSGPGTGNTGTITLTATTSASQGTTTQTVRASGSGVAPVTNTFSLSVTPPPGIGSLSVTPTSVTINPGGSVSLTATITRVGGYTGSVSLLITSTLPSGITATYSNPGTGNTGTITLTATTSVTLGTTTQTVRASGSGAASVTDTFSLISEKLAGIGSLSVTPSSVTLNPGASVSLTATITRVNGYTGSVSLLITSTLPSGVTATYSGPGTGNTGTITLTATTSVTLGTTTQTVTASGTTIASVTDTFNLTVSRPSGIGSLSVTPSSVTLNPGASVSLTATITRVNGYTGSVSLLITSTLPSGVTATYSGPGTGNTGTITLTATTSVTLGTTTQTVTASGTTIASVTDTFDLTVANLAGIGGLEVLPSPITLYPGTSGAVTANITRINGYTGSVSLLITSTLPTGVTASYSGPGTANTGTITLTVDTSTALGTWTLTVRAGGTGIDSVTDTFDLTVGAPPAIGSMDVTPGAITIYQGNSGQLAVSITRTNGYTGSVSLLITSTLPTGVTAAYSGPGTGDSGTITLTASTSAALGTLTITVSASGSSVNPVTDTFDLTVGPRPAIGSLDVVPALIEVYQGNTADLAASITRISGYTGSVSLLITSSLPTGVSASYSGPGTGNSGTITLTADVSALLGTWTLTIAATGSDVDSVTDTVELTVGPRQAITLDITPPAISVYRGGTAQLQATISRISNYQGAITLSISPAPPAGISFGLVHPETTSTGTITVDVQPSASLGASSFVATASGPGIVPVTDTFTITVVQEYFILSDVRVQDGSEAFSVYVKPSSVGNGFDKSTMMTMADWSRISSLYLTELESNTSLPLTEASNRGWLDLVADATYPRWFTSYRFDTRVFSSGNDMFFAPPIYRPLVLELAYGGLNPFDSAERQNLYSRYLMDAVSGRNVEYPTELQDVQVDTTTLHLERLDADVAAGLVSDLSVIAGDVEDSDVLDFINGRTLSIGKGHSIARLLKEYGRILQANPTLVNQLRIGTDILEIAGDLAQVGLTVENEATAEIAMRAYLNSSAIAKRRLALLGEAYQYCRNNGLSNLDASLGAALTSLSSMIGTEEAAWRSNLSAVLNQGTVANLLEYGIGIADVITEISTGRPDATVSGQILVRIVRALSENVNSPIFKNVPEHPLWGSVVAGATTFVRLLSKASEFYRNYAAALTVNEMLARYDSYLPFQSGTIIDPPIVIKKKDAMFLLTYQAYRLIDLTVDYYAPSSGWEWVMWLEDAGVSLLSAGPTAGFSMVSPITQGAMMAITQLQNWVYDDILDDARQELQNIMDGYEANRTADRNLRTFFETNYLTGSTTPDIPDVPTSQLRIIPILNQSVEVGSTVTVLVGIEGLAQGDTANIAFSGYRSGTGNQIPISPTLEEVGQHQITVLASSASSGSDEYVFNVEVIPVVLLPEINVLGYASGAVHDFGSVTVGASAEASFTIENLGTGTLALYGNPIISITGINAAEYHVELQPTSEIASASSSCFVIWFSPTSAGQKEASILIQNSDYDEGRYLISFAGGGLATYPEIDIQRGATPIPDGHTFNLGSVNAGSATQWYDFMIWNNGSADLILNNGQFPVITITGANISDFMVDYQPGTTIVPGWPSEFSIVFRPWKPGLFDVHISIASNDQDENPYDISWTGEVIPSPVKNDFNWDGHEDILWRYYGTGGRNRVWFLGSTVGLSQNQVVSAQPDSAEKSMVSVEEMTRRRLKDPRDMGWSSSRSETVVSKRDLMGESTAQDRRPIVIDDPRMAGILKGESLDLSPLLSVTDPTQLNKLIGNEAKLSAAFSIQASTYLGGADLLTVEDPNWQIVGTGDFNHDRNVDILWRYNASPGWNLVWLMKGTHWDQTIELEPVEDPNWHVVGTGDFNKDGNTDILWRYDGTYSGIAGFNWIWYMNGTNWIGGHEILSVADLNWQVAGIADFNKDGNIDILWRYNGTGGYNCVWYMDGPEWTQTVQLYPVEDSNWHIGGVGDFNGDGNVDIVWRYNGTYLGTEGLNWFWYMTGTSLIGGEATISVPDLKWKIANR